MSAKPKTVEKDGVEYRVLSETVGGDFYVYGDKGTPTLIRKDECKVVEYRDYQNDFGIPL